MNSYRGALTLLICMSSLVACTSAEKKAANAEAAYTQEKTNTLKEYKECVKDAGGDEQDLKQCDALLKAIEAVEGSESKVDK